MSKKLFEALYPYQIEDSDRMLSGGNWLNLSEMGTGKTLEALSVIEKGGYKQPLILCPNSLMYEWRNQVDAWIGEGNAVVSAGAWDHKLSPIIDALRMGVKYKILNYEALRKKDYLDILKLGPWDVIICDEVHKLRNPDTKAAKGIWTLLEAFPDLKLVCQSGSPIMNYPNDLYVPLSLVKPSDFPRNMTGWRFFMREHFLWSQGTHGYYIYGAQKQKALMEQIKPYSIRRTKKEALPFLPEKYFRKVTLQMPPDQRKLYDDMATKLKILLDSGEPLYSTNVLDTITRLRQLNLDPKILGVTCASAKTDFFRDLIVNMEEKLVIFSCFERYIAILSLLGTPENSVVITGLVPTEERLKRVKSFQEDPSIKFCFGTIQSMGEGITLTAASNVILMDRWWNEPTNTQAVDRLHRIGQVNKVQVILPVVERSIDQTLDAILQRKDSMRDEFLPEAEVRRYILEDL